jgi:predicted permease
MPDWNDEIRTRLRPIDLDPAAEAEIVREVGQHLDDRYAALRAEGYEPDAAYAAALEDLREDERMRHELLGTQRRVGDPVVTYATGTTGLARTLLRDLHWAWRGLVSRRWRPLLSVGVLSLALAANALVFAVADSLVFHRAPYRDIERLVEIQQRDIRTGRPGSSFLSPALLDEWRQQTDLFAGVEGSLTRMIFLSGAGEPAMVTAADVTVGLVPLLGARPRWGRQFVDADARQHSPQAVLIAESLAVERFGDPAAAIGQLLPTTGEPLVVVGVMPPEFRYPNGTERIWRALDPRGPLAAGFAGVASVARLRAGVDQKQVSVLVEDRSVRIGSAAGARQGYAAVVTPLHSTETAADRRRMFLVLVGASLCVLLIACANVACLELAGALTRARTYAIQLAVGASRASLVRGALFEGTLIVAAATLLALGLATEGARTMLAYLPPVIVTGSPNPVDIDRRALLFMGVTAMVTTVLSTLPVVAFAWRSNLLELLKAEGPAVATSRSGGHFRRALTIAQVALAVLLLVGTLLYVRTYAALLRLDKGFDSGGVVSISLTIPPQAMGTAADRHAMAETLLARIRARPGVAGAFEGSPPPASGDSPTSINEIEVDDRGPVETHLLFPKLYVEPDYFRVLRIPLLGGRMFESAEPPTSVMISQALASRLWPGQDAIGHRFRESPQRPWLQVVGVVGHVRLFQDGTRGPDSYHQLYFARQPPPPPPPARSAPPRMRFAMPSYALMAITVRVDSRDRVSDLYQTTRSVDPRNILKLEFVDDQYAGQFADRLLATRVIGAFGMLACVVAGAGIYGLMAFLVASRAREMGIRIALGASAADIRRLVLGASLRLVVAGAAIGIVSAIIASRWIGSQLYGVAPTDPLILTGVTVGMIAVALAATWRPARHAVQVDPTQLLKG